MVEPVTGRRAARALLGAATVEMERALVDASAARTEVACAVAGLLDALDERDPDDDTEAPGDRRPDPRD